MQHTILEKYLNTLTPMQAGKARKTLETLVRYSVTGEALSRWQLVLKLLGEGRKPEVIEKRDSAAINKAQARLAAISKRYIVGLSNPNIPEVKEALELREKLANNYFTKKEYGLSLNEDRWLEITKLEYEFAKAIAV